MTKLKYFIKLARVNQYTKNLFIFLPAFFNLQLYDYSIFKNSILSFISFSFVASSIYILNDVIDVNEDVLHPEKKNRPIASGRIKVTEAYVFSSILLLLGLLVAFVISSNVLILICSYLALNFAYSMGLKKIAIVDIVIVSTGFVLRLFVGSYSTNISLSHWIIIMTFLLSIFLALAKRRDDLIIYRDSKIKMRKSMEAYNLKFIDSALVISSSIVILAYILWSISEDVVIKFNTSYLYVSSIFVFLGIMRYLQITFVEEKSGNPSKILLTDFFLIITIILWILFFTFIKLF